MGYRTYPHPLATIPTPILWLPYLSPSLGYHTYPPSFGYHTYPPSLGYHTYPILGLPYLPTPTYLVLVDACDDVTLPQVGQRRERIFQRPVPEKSNQALIK